jgi:hypothetical protein
LLATSYAFDSAGSSEIALLCQVGAELLPVDVSVMSNKVFEFLVESNMMAPFSNILAG